MSCERAHIPVMSRRTRQARIAFPRELFMVSACLRGRGARSLSL